MRLLVAYKNGAHQALCSVIDASLDVLYKERPDLDEGGEQGLEDAVGDRPPSLAALMCPNAPSDTRVVVSKLRSVYGKLDSIAQLIEDTSISEQSMRDYYCTSG